MKFLKVLINSLISGIFFSSLLALLVLDLNVNHIFNISFFGELTLFLTITYGVVITIICVFLFFIIQFFLGKKFKIAIISPSFLSMSFSLILFLFLLIFKANYDYFLSFFNLETRALLKTQLMTLLFLAVLGLLSYFGYHSYKKKVLFFWFYLFLLGTAITFAFYQRVNYPIPQKSKKVANLEAKKIDRKITIIGLEGLSFDFIIPLINEEKLPNFSWLMEEGTWGKLKNFSPNEPLLLNNSFNTGKLPAKHRQISLLSYRFLKFNQEVEVVPRFIFFKQLTRTSLLLTSSKQPTSYTKDVWTIFKDNKTEFLLRDWPYDIAEEKASPGAEKLFNQFFKDLQFETSGIFNRLKKAFYADYEFEDRVTKEKIKKQPQFVYFMLNGLNIVETYFYKYSFPDLFGDIEQEEINKYSSVIERYYQFYDGIIGKHLASLKEDELLIVYSPHGIEAVPLWKRFVDLIFGNADVSAYHELAPEGVVFFYGKEIVRGKNIEGMKLIDIAPTLLNYLGLPVGKDMDGIVNSSIFMERFKLGNPVLYISSYEEIAIKQPE